MYLLQIDIRNQLLLNFYKTSDTKKWHKLFNIQIQFYLNSLYRLNSFVQSSRNCRCAYTSIHVILLFLKLSLEHTQSL